MSYEVRTGVFEGPFDLLLHLILQQEVDLYEVSLHHIVDAYLAEVDAMLSASESASGPGRLDLETATEFLLIAATLVELKTRRLLPVDSTTDLDEELGIWEERDLLLSRLLECKTFKNAAVALERLAAVASRSVPRTAGPDERFAAVVPDVLEGIGPDRIAAAFMRAMTPKAQPRVELHHVAPITATVTDAIAELVDELPRAGRMSFRSLTDGLFERMEVVVRFLAVLELFKQGYVDLDQAGRFGDIVITWVGGSDVGLVSVGADSYDG